MRVLIVGAGVTGTTLAARLCEEQHDVVIIDRDPKALDEVSTRSDVMSVVGSGTNPVTLSKAGIAKTDLLVAVTDNDERNMLACAMAKRAGVARTVAHVTDMSYAAATDWYTHELLGVDVVVSQSEEAARELFNILQLPSASEVVRMLDGRVQVVGVRVGAESVLFGATPAAFPKPDFLESIRFVAIMRGGKLIVPRGDTVFIEDDQLYVLGMPSKTLEFVHWACPLQHETMKVIIAGGGGTGFPLARRLEQTNTNIVLIEPDSERASFCSSELGRTLVLQADVLNEDTLRDVGITEQTTFVAVTGNDEKNILSGILAKKLGAPFVLSQVSLPGIVSIAESIDALDRVISLKKSTTDAILHLARWRNIEHYAFLRTVPGQLIEFHVEKTSKWKGSEIRDVPMPHDAIIAAVVRGPDVMVATGTLTLEVNDRVVVFAHPNVVDKVETTVNIAV